MKIQFIINSRSSWLPMSAMTALIRKRFAGHDYRIDCTEYPGHAGYLAGRAVGRGDDAVVAVGGDGTVHEVVNGAGWGSAPIGIIPTGSANDLAERLGIPSAFEEACDVILSNKIKRIDAMTANGRIILTTCGFGFPAEVISAVRRSLRWIIMLRLVEGNGRHRIYIAGVVLALLRKLPYTPVQVCYDGRRRRMSTVSLIIGLQPNLGRNFIPLPHAHLDRAVMAAYSINTGNRLRLLRHIRRTTKGTQHVLGETWFMHARRITLELPEAMPFFGDGELLPADDRFEIECRPAAIPFFVPSTGRDRR